MSDVKTENRGGKRVGAGRPKQEETKMMRIPSSLVDQVKALIKQKKWLDSLD